MRDAGVVLAFNVQCFGAYAMTLEARLPDDTTRESQTAAPTAFSLAMCGPDAQGLRPGLRLASHAGTARGVHRRIDVSNIEGPSTVAVYRALRRRGPSVRKVRALHLQVQGHWRVLRN